MTQFWKMVSGVVVTLAALATILAYVPNIVTETVPFLIRLVAGNHTKPVPRISPTQFPEPTQTPTQAIIDDRYVLPVGVTTITFEQCLSKHTFVINRDYSIKELSSIYRVIVPFASPTTMAAAYVECIDQLKAP